MARDFGLTACLSPNRDGLNSFIGKAPAPRIHGVAETEALLDHLAVNPQWICALGTPAQDNGGWWRAVRSLDEI